MIRIGLVGHGYWGPNLLRNFYECAKTEVKMVCDLSPNNLNKVLLKYPKIHITVDYSELLKSKEIDVIVIATPVGTHYELALNALKSGKHVFVEKPLTNSSDQATRLINEAENRNLILHVDHTFIYTTAVRKIYELVTNGTIGELFYYDSVRVNLGLFQHDVNVIWDLAVHDLSIMNYLIQEKPIAVSATGMSHLSGNPENTAYLTLHFNSSTIAHIHVNWLSPVKIRQTLLSGSKKMLVYNDLEPIEKIKVYDSGVNTETNSKHRYEMLVGYRTGDVWSPNIRGTEALHDEIEHFVACVEEKKSTLSDGLAGLAVVRTSEAAIKSISLRGRPVDIETLEVI